MLQYASHRSLRSRLSSFPVRCAPSLRWCHSTPVHNIVVLDQWFPTFPRFDFDYTIKYYNSTKPDQLPSRLKDATIAIATTTPITREGILASNNLQLVALNGTGTDAVDISTLHELGIALCYAPSQAVDSVAEHALALYYGLRRNLLKSHVLAVEGKVWESFNGLQTRLQPLGSPPRINNEEVMVVLGYGALGRKIESLGKALSMRVLIAERKHALQTRPGRVPFLQCLAQGTLFIVAAPLNETTRAMIGASELATMDPTSILVNVSRGGIVDEFALVDALRQGQIGGAATDVFSEEPATKENSPLLDPSIPNLLLTPHVAWYAKRTIENVLLTQRANLEGFVSMKMANIILPLQKGKAGRFDAAGK